MKTLSTAFAFLFIGVLATLGGDYTPIRTKDIMPGGGTGTNVLKVYCNSDCSGAEIVELFAWNTATIDTATVVRVSADAQLTNTLAVITVPGSVVLNGTNTLYKTGALQLGDYLQVTASVTNKFYFGTGQRVHQR